MDRSLPKSCGWPSDQGAIVFWHYLVSALRHFARRKLYSFINVLGLAVALTCAILILLFVKYQLSYDTWLPDTSNLYRLELTMHLAGPLIPQARTNPPDVAGLLSQIPQVKAITYLGPEQMTVEVGNRQFSETVTRVNPNLFQVIKLPLVSGDPVHVLSLPGSVVLSETMARKFFGDADPVGKFLTLTTLAQPFGARTLRVAGVLRDLPTNSQLVADVIVPDSASTGIVGSAYVYVQLLAGATPAKVLQELKPILDATFHVKFGNVEYSASEIEQYHLTRFRDVHLTGGRWGGMTPSGSPATVYGFAIIAFLILLIASANFMNLSTALATLRAREIGLRKVAGAVYRQLMAQFLIEAVLISLISLVVAMALVEILLPVYDRLLAEPIRLQYLAEWRLFVAIGGGAVALGLLGGAYPALVLSRFRPDEALRVSGASPTGSGALRSALVLGQFAVSIALGVAATVVFRQIDFARGLDLGFSRDHIIVMRGTTDMSVERREGLVRALGGGPGVISTALVDDVPFGPEPVDQGLLNAQGSSQVLSIHFTNITPGYPALLGMRLLAGRLLSPTHGDDTPPAKGVRNVLINAETARRMGVSANGALGRVLTSGNVRVRVVGVLADAKVRGVRDPVMPTIYEADPFATDLLIKVNGGDLLRTLMFIDRTWRSWAPGVVPDRYFLGSAFAGLFESDERQGTVLALFVALGVFIACLGLFGLTVFTAERHTKEIGIRKAAGARTWDILRLMLWRISVPVVVANVIAWPVAYIYLRHWLDGYAYRITLNPVYFVAAGAAALLIAWATVYANTLRLAQTSPVHALRYE
jgi:putative ABC transport system permease protein